MIGRVIWRFPEVGSTQSVAFRLAELGAAHGTVIRADHQTAGRGRQGRAWESAPNSALMFSVILRPAFPLHELGGISILVGDLLAQTIDEISHETVHIKWPNDVLIDAQKVSGILLQTRSGPNAVAVLGIGINIESQTKEHRAGATFLNRHAIHPIDAETLFPIILKRIDTIWRDLQPELTPVQVERIESRMWLMGESVSIIDADREVQGTITGIAKNGGLRLSVDGSERVVVAGEIVRGPRPITEPNVN